MNHKPLSGASVTLTAAMLREALGFIAPDETPDQLETEIVIEWGELGHSGPGYYCWSYEYPEEGSILLGEEQPPAAKRERLCSKCNGRKTVVENNLRGQRIPCPECAP